jgi:hypothetical protein
MKEAAIGVLLASLVLISPHPARADGDDDDGCREVLTAITSSVDTTNCSSVCTSGQLGGPEGLLQSGTSHFVVTTLDSSTPIWKYTGRLDITTAVGTLSLMSTGTIDFETTPPTFRETEAVIDGTGAFAGITSHSRTTSAGTFSGTTFLGTIRGRLCLHDRDR